MGRLTWGVGARPFAVVDGSGDGFIVGVYLPGAVAVDGARAAGAPGWWIVDDEAALPALVEAAWRGVAPRRLQAELDRQRSSSPL